jgi:hypothetical protein
MTFTAMQSEDDVAIEVSITRHYGSISVTLGARVTCEVTTPHAMTRAYDETVDSLIREHRRQAERLRGVSGETSKPTGTAGGTEGAGVNPSQEIDGTTEMIAVEVIEVELKDEKRYYKVRGGRWTKHGVRLWISDPLTVAGVKDIKWEELRIGKTDVRKMGLRAVLSMAGAKPVKVLQLLPGDVEF